MLKNLRVRSLILIVPPLLRRNPSRRLRRTGIPWRRSISNVRTRHSQMITRTFIILILSTVSPSFRIRLRRNTTRPGR